MVYHPFTTLKTSTVSECPLVSTHLQSLCGTPLLYRWPVQQRGRKVNVWCRELDSCLSPRSAGTEQMCPQCCTHGCWEEKVKQLAWLSPKFNSSKAHVYSLRWWVGRNDWPAILQTNADDVSYLGCTVSSLSLLLLCDVTRLLHVLHTQDRSPQWDTLDRPRDGSVQGEDLYVAVVGAASSTCNLITMDSNSRQVKLCVIVFW